MSSLDIVAKRLIDTWIENKSNRNTEKNRKKQKNTTIKQQQHIDLK